MLVPILTPMIVMVKFLAIMRMTKTIEIGIVNTETINDPEND